MDYVADRVHHALSISPDTSPLETLLKSGLNPDSVFLSPRFREANGKTFLQICCSNCDYTKIELLVKYGCHVNYSSKEVISPCERRISYQLDSDVQDLTRTCLYYAICTDNVRLVRVLISAGADVSIRCRDRMTALMHAVDSNNLSIVRAIAECKKCDINSQDTYGLSALHIAVIHGLDPIVQYLLDRRARVDLPQMQGGTPLFMASSRTTIKLLLKYGSDPNHCILENVTALSCIVKKTSDVGCLIDLLDAGCKITKSLVTDLENRPPTLLASNPDLITLLKDRAARPISLKLLSVAVIRRCVLVASAGVGLGLYKRSELLPLPRLLREYVRDLGLNHDET